MKKIGFKDSTGKDIKIGDICYKDHSRRQGFVGEWLEEFCIVTVEEEYGGFWFHITDRGNCTDGFVADGWSGNALTNDTWLKDGNCVQLTIIGNTKTPKETLIKRVNNLTKQKE